MATPRDVARIALSLPGVKASKKDFAFSVTRQDAEKRFVWSWKERVNPKKPRVENLGVLAVRVASLFEKELLLGASKKKFFTEPHYDGFPAVLVRLPEVAARELRTLITQAWKCFPPK